MADDALIRGAPAFTTGGGGFEFEDEVGTWAMAAMLAGEAPIGPLAVPSRIEFQQKVPPAALDDIVVRSGSDESAISWFASIKAFDILRDGLAEFVEAAWLQLLADALDPDRDYIGFVCAEARPEQWGSLLKLIETARNDAPDRLAQCIEAQGVFNQNDRHLWARFRCPERLLHEVGVDLESSPAVLLARLVPLHLDFRSPDSAAKAQARAWCEAALATGHAGQASDLYNTAFGLVSRTRPFGGSIDWGRAAHELGPRFALALRPDASPDWAVLDRHTAERIGAVRDSLAGGLRLPRRDANAELSRVAESPLVYLTGPSGCGKTALAKAWLSETDGNLLWLSAADLRDGLIEFGRRLDLRLTLDEILSLGQAPVRVVVDGLDRTYDEQPIAAAAELARSADASAGAVQLLITSQAFQVERLVRIIASLQAPAHETAIMGDLDDHDVDVALEQRPALRRLVYQGRLRDVLRRPKLLQVVFQTLDRTTDDALAGVSDEAAVAELWWEHLALGPQRQAPRGELVRRLAAHLGDHLLSQLPAGHLDQAGLDSYAEHVGPLRDEEILDPSSEDYGFAHDLFGDWSRYRVLGEWQVARERIPEKAPLPSWHLAIRLFALTSLRREGPERWTEYHDALRADGHDIAADLFLDAPLFAEDAARHLEALWPTLMGDQGRLLHRALNRFSLIASVPDPRGALLASGSAKPELAAYIATTWRVPIWVLWPSILRVLADHAEDAVPSAPLQVAAIADKWLRSAPREAVGMKEAAHLGLMIGEFLARAGVEGRYFDDDDDKKLWRAFLAAGGISPTEISDGALAVLAAGLQPVEDLL